MLSKLELEFAQLRHRWKLFCELYDKEENVELLNKSGAHIFSLFQKLAIDDTMLALCRICDPPKSCGRPNNSLKYHFESVRNIIDSKKVRNIENQIKSLDVHMENIREIRNKGVSHNDYAVAIGSSDLLKVTYDEIELSIKMVRKILNQLFGTRGEYMPVTNGSGSNTLLRILSNNVG